jgi:L-amino acid N-acyltransferase YncA
MASRLPTTPLCTGTDGTDNAASLKLWDTLGFQRVGLIPGAGRLRTADGKGEEYVDAIVVHKNFV